MVKLPYILLGYINTLTLAPCTNKSTPKLSETIKQFVKKKKTNHLNVFKKLPLILVVG
jgi:hypothetical protein